MRTALGHGAAVVLLYALLWLCVAVVAQIEGDLASRIAKDSINKISSSTTGSEHGSDTRHTTCQSGTVNYITHSLPQQCLTRTTPITTNSTNSVEPVTTSSTSTDSTPQETTTTSTVTQTASVTQSETEFETDSPLDNANFLSFEEWKKQNLAKVGQSPEHVGQQGRSSQDKAPRNMPHIDNALDVLGEDSEIVLDFGGFGRQETEVPSSTPPQPSASSNPALRSKDAGKTCKERSNYASFDCAATVLKSNPESKSASAVLIENKDSYMLNICSSSNKFFIVELCDDILIDTIVLANYEFFSSIFRTFRISVSDRYPVKADRWKELGVFEARNTRSVQAFLVEQPLIWARYLRIEFLTHYGNEYYCPVSLLRVHGTTMMEEFRHQEELARGEISDDLEESVMPDASESPAQEPPQVSKDADSSVAVESVTPIKVPSESIQESSSVISSSTTLTSVPSADDTTNTVSDSSMTATSSVNVSHTESANTNNPSVTSSTILNSSTSVPPRTEPHSQDISSTGILNDRTKESSSTSANISMSSTVSSAKPSSSTSLATTPSPSTVEPTKVSNSTQHVQITSLSNSANDSVPAISTSMPHVASNSTVSKSQASSSKPVPASQDVVQRPGTSTASAVQPNPTTQESFFKSIHKRLQMLESNATLSLQYIEEQSRILRDAFMKVEKRQIKKTEAFLQNLNTTVSAELQEFKQQYDQLWQSTVIELENHREQYQREILAVSARLSVVADELVFQKRMAVVQSTLLMLCLGLLLFVRTGGGAVDVPILQQMVNRSQYGARSSYYSPLNSPSPDQSSPPALLGNSSRRMSRFWRSSVDTPVSARPISRGNGNVSEASFEEHARRDNPDLKFDPPTPTHETGPTADGEDGILVSPSTSSMHDEISVIQKRSESGEDGEEADMDSPKTLPHETQSSPSTPSGSRDQQTALKMLPQWPLQQQEEGENVNSEAEVKSADETIEGA